MLPIITNKSDLRKPSVNVSSLQEGLELSTKLTGHPDYLKNGIGLSAPQIGIFQRVAVVRVDREIIFINPVIHSLDGETMYFEGCLSFPNRSVKTKRAIRVTVKADFIIIDGDKIENATMTFGPEDINEVGSGPTLMEAVAIQHEIDHLDGILMFDRLAPKTEPIRVGRKIGRNEVVTIESLKSDETKKLKYKKAISYIESGDWVIVD